MIKTVDYVVCLPGHPSSGMQSINLWLTLMGLMGKGKRLELTFSFSSNIYAVRNACLRRGGNKKYQKPFDGKIDYEKMIWVDSDNYVDPEKVNKLLSHNVDIVGAWYRMYNSIDDLGPQNKSACGLRAIDGSGGNGVRPFLVSEIPTMPRDERGLIEVGYIGFGLLVMKKEVVDSIEYPWFRSWVVEWEEDGVEMADIITDDDGFILRARKNGYRAYIDPEVQILHEKRVAV